MTTKQSTTSDIPLTSVANKRKDKTPLYIQLAIQLKDLIKNNYKAGDTLPAESTLADEFGVNRHTIHRAINELVIEGYVMCHQGKRAEVLNMQPLKYALSIGKFTSSINRLGKQSKTHILTVKTINPVFKDLKELFDNEPLSQLSSNGLIDISSAQIKSQDKDKNERIIIDKKKTDIDYLILIRTLRVVDEQPITIIDHYLNPIFVPDIANYYQNGSLHTCIKAHYGYDLIRANAQISARLPKLDEVDYLNCHSQQPLLIVTSVNCNKHDPSQVVEVSFSHTRADKMSINI